MDLQQQLEQRYQQSQKRGQSLSERLTLLDQYAGQVNPEIRKQVLDFSNRPAGYNPLQDIQTALEISERSRATRGAAATDFQNNQTQGLDLLTMLQSLAKQKSDQSYNDRALALKEAESGAVYNPTTGLYDVSASVDVDKLLKRRAELNKQGLDTKAVDAQLEAAGYKPSGSVSQEAKEVNRIINELLSDNADIGGITGVNQLMRFIPGSKAAYSAELVDQLKGILSLENRQKLKGQGTITDKEMAMLEKAATILGGNLSKGQFQNELKKLQKDFAGLTVDKDAGKELINKYWNL